MATKKVKPQDPEHADRHKKYRHWHRKGIKEKRGKDYWHRKGIKKKED